MISERFKTQSKMHQLGPSHYKKLNDINNRLNKLNDLFIDGDIAAADYHKTKNRYQNIFRELKVKEEAQNKQSETLELYKKNLKILTIYLLTLKLLKKGN